ncbi:hypothetical protein GCM10027059_37930 [Myceligenerans halotolerans]
MTSSYFSGVLGPAVLGTLKISAVAAVGLGLALAVAIAVSATARVFYLHPAPVDLKEFRRRTREGAVRGGGVRDRAWPGYLVSQPGTDIDLLGKDIRRRYGRAWTLSRVAMAFLWKWGFLAVVVLPLVAWIAVASADVPIWWLGIAAIPGGASIVLGAVSGGTVLLAEFFGFVIMVAYALAHMLQNGVGRPLRGLARITLYVLDAVTGRRGASCPKCYYVMARPSYRCGGCGATHSDVRPGLLGVLWRRCECGTRLPLTVVRASHHLDPVCVRCGETLPRLSGVATQVRIAVFGDPGAGKSRLVAAGLHRLVSAATASGVEASFSGAGLVLEEERDRILDDSDLDPTGGGARPAAVVQFRGGFSATHVHVFDVAGHRYRNGSLHDDHGFLSTAHGLVFVVDPFALEPVVRLAARAAPALVRKHPSTGSVETAYSEVVQRIRATTQARHQRLAVVVSKIDLLRRAGVDVPSNDADLAAWLRDQGLHNLVAGARADFAAVSYFAVSSTIPPDLGHDAGAPFHWLLGVHRSRVPGATEPGRTTEKTPEPVGS